MLILKCNGAQGATVGAWGGWGPHLATDGVGLVLVVPEAPLFDERHVPLLLELRGCGDLRVRPKRTRRP